LLRLLPLSRQRLRRVPVPYGTSTSLRLCMVLARAARGIALLLWLRSFVRSTARVRWWLLGFCGSCFAAGTVLRWCDWSMA